jgi:hypothetical protein
MTNSTPSGPTGRGTGTTGYETGSGAGVTGYETGSGAGVTGAVDANTTQTGLRDEASNLASEAGSAGRRVADVTKDETRAVASETKQQARRLADQARSELRAQAATQQTRVASGLHSVGGELSRMADSSAEPGVATDVVREAGRRADDVARWLDQRDPGSLLEEVKSFARRRPGVFLAIAVGAGVVAGRLARALATPAEDEGQGASAARSTYGTPAYGVTGTDVIDDLPRATTPTAVGTTGGAGTTYGVEGVGLTEPGTEGIPPRTSGSGLS